MKVTTKARTAQIETWQNTNNIHSEKNFSSSHNKSEPAVCTLTVLKVVPNVSAWLETFK